MFESTLEISDSLKLQQHLTKGLFLKFIQD